MRRLMPIAAAILALVAVVALVGCTSSAPPATSTAPSTSGSSSAPAANATAVTIANFAFTPGEVTIKAGDTVTWTNNDTVAHTVTGNGFDSGSIPQGGTYSHTFDTAGSFDYHCTFHPQMAPGKVTVQ